MDVWIFHCRDHRRAGCGDVMKSDPLTGSCSSLSSWDPVSGPHIRHIFRGEAVLKPLLIPYFTVTSPDGLRRGKSSKSQRAEHRSSLDP